MRARSLLILAALAACDDAKETPVAVGRGLILEPRVPALMIDRDHVPQISACTEGQVPQSEGNALWKCAELPAFDSRLAELEVIHQDLAASWAMPPLTLLDGLWPRIDTVENALTAAEPNPEPTPPLIIGAASCQVSPVRARGRQLARIGANITYIGTSTGANDVYCPVYATGALFDWNRMTVYSHDPDGPGTGATIQVELKPVRKSDGFPFGDIFAGERLDNSNDQPDPNVMIIDLTGLELDLARGTYYYVGISLEKTRRDLQPSFSGFKFSKE